MCALILIVMVSGRHAVTVPGKTDHFVIISDFKILIPCSSVLFTLCNGKITIVIAYTVLE